MTTAPSVDETLALVSELAANEDFAGALELIEPLRKAAPDNPSVLGVFGGILLRQNKFLEASEYFRKATVISPRSELASAGLFHCLWNLGRFDEAMKEVARLLTLRESTEYALLLDEMGWELSNGEVVERPRAGRSDDE